MELFTGSGVDLVTPMYGGDFDVPALTRLIELQIASDADALIVCSQCGEGFLLDHDEKAELFRFIVDRVESRRPVIACTGCPSTAQTIEFSRLAEAIGVDALLIGCPASIKASDQGLLLHFSSILDELRLPVIISGSACRSDSALSQETVSSLSEYENLCGFIFDFSPSLAPLDTHGKALYCASDENALNALTLGASALISPAANVVPSMMHELCLAVFEGRADQAAALNTALAPLFKLLSDEPLSVIVKAFLSRMNLCHEELRLPLTPPSAELLRDIQAVLSRLELI